MITRTEGARNKTKLAEAKEIANLEYLNWKIGDYVNGTETNIAMVNVISELNRQGIATYTKISEGPIITGAVLLDGNSEVESPLKLGFGDSKNLTISTMSSNENSDYYVIIDGLYYKIIPENKGLDILKDGVTLESITSGSTNTQLITMSVTGLDNSTTVKKIIVSEENTTYQDITEETTFENGDSIKITAGEDGLTGAKINVFVSGVTEQYEVGIIVSQPKAFYYGTKVTTGVTSVNGVDIGDNWKIFYADNDNVYLIYGYCYPANLQTEIKSGINSTIFIPANTENANYYGSDTNYTYSVNSRTDKNTLIRYLKNNTSYDYTSYTTKKDYDNVGVGETANQYDSWKNLLTAFNGGNKLAQKAISVLGSPTFEMWIDSWNEKYNETDGKVEKLRTFVKGGNIEGYLIGDSNTTSTSSLRNKVGNATARTGYYDELYYPFRKTMPSSEGYWLSSPGGWDDSSLCSVNYLNRSSIL